MTSPRAIRAHRLAAAPLLLAVWLVAMPGAAQQMPGGDIPPKRGSAPAPGSVPERASPPRGPVRSVVLANRHLTTVQGVYLSPSTEADWGPDRLGNATLAVEADTTVEMEGGCVADLRVVFVGGGAEERRAVDVCATTRVVLRPGWVLAERLDEEGPVEALMPAPSPNALRLRNGGPLPIVELYAFTPGTARGEDRLGEDILPIGAVFEIEPDAPNACTADLVAVFRDGREVTQSAVDLCAGEEIDLR